MSKKKIKEISITLAHAIVTWALCGAVIAIGEAIVGEIDNTVLIIHAIAAPIIAALVSLLYFTKFNYFKPIQMAFIMMGAAITLDIFIVSLLINKNFEMFESFLGTWLVFILIFFSTLIVGKSVNKK